MRVGIAADHGGYALKTHLIELLQKAGHEVVDFGAESLQLDDDYPDYGAPLARAVASGKVKRGIAICGSGVGICVTVNKIPGVRAALVTDPFSAKQGVEDDDMNIICFGGRVLGDMLAWDLVKLFLSAEYHGGGRFQRRLDKVLALENKESSR